MSPPPDNSLNLDGSSNVMGKEENISGDNYWQMIEPFWESISTYHGSKTFHHSSLRYKLDAARSARPNLALGCFEYLEKYTTED